MSQLTNESIHTLPRIHVALRILPLTSGEEQQTMTKLSETEVLLTTPKKCLVYEFDHVLTEPSNYLYGTLPQAIMNDLLLGYNTSLFIYDPIQKENGLDIKAISLLSYRLFTLKDTNSSINVQYIELAENMTTCRDLLSNDPQYLPIDQIRPQYKIKQVQDIEKSGSEKHECHCVSIFSLTLVQDAKMSTFYIANISGVDYTTRDAVTSHCFHHNKQQEGDMPSPLSNLFIRSKNIHFVAAVAQNNKRQTENIIHYASTIYNYSKGRDPDHVEEEAIQRLGQWIVKLNHNEPHHQYHHHHHHQQQQQQQQQLSRGSINTATMTSFSSASEYDHHRHVSMFSSVSNSTSLTVPESITEEKDHLVFADLYRQIEELQNQVTVTRERNRHVEKELQDLRNSMSSVNIVGSGGGGGGGVNGGYPQNEVLLYKSTSSIDSLNNDVEKLLMVEEKQFMLISGLETKLIQTEHLNKNLEQQLDLLEKEKSLLEENVEREMKSILAEMHALGLKKNELEVMSSVIDQRLESQEYKNTRNEEEISQLKARCQLQETENIKKNRFIESIACQLLVSTTSTTTPISNNNNNDSSDATSTIHINTTANANSVDGEEDESLSSINENRFDELNKCIKELVIQRNRYCEQLKESKDEYEKLQHAFSLKTAKVGLIEKKCQNLEKELGSVRKVLREKDTSGMIRKLEEKIVMMEQEKEHTQSDFESSYESALNEIEAIQRKADEQLRTIHTLERTTAGLHEQLGESSAALIQKDQEKQILLENNQRLLSMNEELNKQYNFFFEHQRGGGGGGGGTPGKDPERPAKARRSRSSVPVRPSAMSYLKGLSEKKPSRFLESQNQLIKWYRQKAESPFGKIEIADRLLQMSEENYQLKVYVDELESKVVIQQRESFKEISSLQSEIITLTNINDQLQWKMGQVTSSTSASASVLEGGGGSGNRKNSLLQNMDLSLPIPPARSPIRHESLGSHRLSGKKPSFLALNNSNSPNSMERTLSVLPTPQSDPINSRHNSYLTIRSTTSSLPPPSDPPTNPLPPIPTTTAAAAARNTSSTENVQDPSNRESASYSVNSTHSEQQQNEGTMRSYKNKIHLLESDIKIHQQVISKLETQLAASEIKVQEQKNKIGILVEETQVTGRTMMNLKTEIAIINDQLQQERELKQKAEKQRQVLEKRLDNALAKKSKFRCF